MVRELARRLSEAAARFTEHKALEEFLVALFAVGICAANCDGEIADIEKQELHEFVLGVSATALPEQVKQSIQALYDAPPSLATAMTYVVRTAAEHRRLFDDVVDVVLLADGRGHPRETAFRAAWRAGTAAMAA